MNVKTIAGIACVIVVIGSPVLAETDPLATAESLTAAEQEKAKPEWMPGIGAGVDVANSYIFKGLTYNDGLVVQPWMTLTLQSFSFTAWANYDADDYNGNIPKNEVSEVDLLLKYAFSVGPVDAVVGYTFWTYPNDSIQDDQLATLDVSHECGKGLRIGVAGEYMTVGTIKETWYVKPYANLAIELTDELSLDCFGDVGYIDYGDNDSGRGWMHYDIGSRVSYRMFALSATYVGRIDKDMLPTGEFGYDTKMLLTAGVWFDY